MIQPSDPDRPAPMLDPDPLAKALATLDRGLARGADDA
jgi:hypothetical protein